MNTILTRRSTLAGAAGLIASPLVLRPTPAEAASFALAPKYTDNWRVHKTSTKAAISPIADGILADTPSTAADITPGNVALWSRNRVSGQWKVTFDYKVRSRLVDSGGTFCCFYFNAVGQGTSRYPANISLWKNITPDDSVYFKHSRGLRFSFATYNPVAHPELQYRMRLRRYSFSNGPYILPESADDFPFTTNVPYLVVVTRKGIRVTVEVTNKDTNETATHFWEDATWIPKWQDGHIGFRWCGQDAELTNLTVGTA